MGEFELIARFFERPGMGAADTPGFLGIGDDCALLPPMPTAVSTDMLVAGRHFFEDADPEALGHKALAVNLSDLAAMGARPVAFTLALALPAVDEDWLGAFARGLFALADAHGCRLVGGDTTRGPLTMCITVFGEVPHDLALRRDRARPGDDIWVSGELGGAAWEVARRVEAGGAAIGADAASAAKADSSVRASAGRRLDRPEPRVGLGYRLRGVAHAAIDLSDGLLGDLGHVLERSGAALGSVPGARIDWPAVPLHGVLQGLSPSRQAGLALAGGDDYELLFTAPVAERERLASMGRECGVTLSRIGRIETAPGIRIVGDDGQLIGIDARPYDHFR